MRYTKLGNVVVIQPGESLDITNAQEFKEWVKKEFIEKGEKNIVLDFSNVKSIDSYALGVFVSLQKSLAPKDGKVVIASPRDTIRRILEVTSLNKIIGVADDVDEALEMVG